MTDIYIALGIMMIIATLLFSLGNFLAKRCSKKYFPLLVFAGMMFIPLHFIFSNSHLTLLLLPFSGAIVFLSWIFPGSTFLAGLAWHKMHKQKIKRCMYAAALLAVGFYVPYHYFFQSRPPSSCKIKDGVFLQSSSSSCSAACAATLLSSYGIPATEKEMIDLCFTTGDGTSLPGLYRGLKLKTDGTSLTVKVAEWSLSQLLDTNKPAIIQVELNRNADINSRYVRDWGWTPGVSHSVIFLGRGKGNRIKIVDPSVGREQWTLQGIKDLWHGYVVFLEKKP